jgi:hypothetical protein
MGRGGRDAPVGGKSGSQFGGHEDEAHCTGPVSSLRVCSQSHWVWARYGMDMGMNTL